MLAGHQSCQLHLPQPCQPPFLPPQPCFASWELPNPWPAASRATRAHLNPAKSQKCKKHSFPWAGNKAGPPSLAKPSPAPNGLVKAGFYNSSPHAAPHNPKVPQDTDRDMESRKMGVLQGKGESSCSICL